jgi:carbonic anhydrase
MEVNELLLKLKIGNERFVLGQTKRFDFSQERNSTAKGQNPKTVVVSCSDSRVVPEYIFDCGLGELFVVRTAGNVICDTVLGTIEFAVSSFDVQQIIVLGHSNCGAINAALGGMEYKGYVNILLDRVKPIVEKLKSASKGEDIVYNSIIENIKTQIKNLLKSDVIKEKQKNGSLKIIPAYYHLDTGRVDFLDG